MSPLAHLIKRKDNFTVDIRLLSVSVSIQDSVFAIPILDNSHNHIFSIDHDHSKTNKMNEAYPKRNYSVSSIEIE